VSRLLLYATTPHRRCQATHTDVTSVPASSTPTCSKCSSLLLGLYAQKSDKYASLNSTIINRAIGTVNNACGSGFVQYYSYSAASNYAPPTQLFNLPLALLASMATMTFWAYLAF
jgi:hypothetical protein